LSEAGQSAAVLTLPDSISWLLNIRGADILRNPVVQALAILHADGRLDLCIAPQKLSDAVQTHLGPDVNLAAPDGFSGLLAHLSGKVRVDRATAPLAVSSALTSAGVEVAWGADPCLLPKAIKNPVEIAGMEEAHLRDGAAMAEFLAWLGREAPKGG
jgi:Xaa-Pro aminopeptidase